MRFCRASTICTTSPFGDFAAAPSCTLSGSSIGAARDADTPLEWLGSLGPASGTGGIENLRPDENIGALVFPRRISGKGDDAPASPPPYANAAGACAEMPISATSADSGTAGPSSDVEPLGRGPYPAGITRLGVQRFCNRGFFLVIRW